MARPSRTGGKISEAKARNASPAKGRKTTKTKHSIASAATRVKRRSVSDPSKDLKEAREQQAATADILKVIASSPDNVQPVFEVIVASAARLIGAFSAGVYRFVDGVVHLGAITSVSPAGDEVLRVRFPRPIDDAFAMTLAGEVVQFADIEDHPNEGVKEAALVRGYRSMLYVPLKSSGTSIGAIIVTRATTGAFAPHHIELLQTFADQAVIAIENARLFNEVQAKTADLTESLQQQTATADVLKVISGSAFDLDTVMDALTRSARHLCGAAGGALFLRDGDRLVCRGVEAVSPADEQFMKANPVSLNDQSHMGRAVLTGTVVNVGDIESQLKLGRFQKAMGFKAFLAVPLMREGQGVGVLTLVRFEVGEFTQRQVELVQTFADQAVIALENTRLFNETQEALERQTATADILKVIASSPNDVQPVFDTIAESARRLCGGHTSIVTQVSGEFLHLGASSADSEDGVEEVRAEFPLPLSIDRVHGRAALNGEIAIRYDTENEPDVSPTMRMTARARGYRSLLVVPMMRDGVAIGTIGVSRREAGRFPDKSIELLRTFADQAVIAIENVRLFNETQEALERQTATADILKVIASSPSDVQPVFEAIASSANRLIGAFSASVYRFVDGLVHLAAITSVSATGDEALRASFPRPIDNDYFRAAHTGEVVEVADTEDQPVEKLRDLARARGFRSILYVPLKSLGTSIGVITVSRQTAGAFAAHHIDLLQTFADQAVIAIGNVRLFEEVQDKTRDLSESLEHQTAISDILQVISGSPGDVRPVFMTVARHAAQICEAKVVDILTVEDDRLLFAANVGEFARADGAPLNRDSVMGRSIIDKEPIHVVDLQSKDHDFPLGRDFAFALGHRTTLAVPLIREGRALGTILVRRAEVRPFADRHIALLKTFADQAAIAIENARLLNEIQAKTRDLSEALQQQTATADVLKVISRSAFDLQTVLDTLVESAAKLCSATGGNIRIRDGEVLRAKAFFGASEDLKDFIRNHPLARDRRRIVGRAFLTGELVHVRDVLSDPEYEASVEWARRWGYRALLAVPMVREGRVEGVFSLSRPEPTAFSDREIELVRTFVDQALIAIENVRLFNETQEALERQTATADILKVIASSPSDVQPVFEAIAERSNRLIDGLSTAVYSIVDDARHLMAFTRISPEADAALQASFPRPLSEAPWGDRIRRGEIVEIANAEAEMAERPSMLDVMRLRGFRSVLFVPLQRDGATIGVISVTRREPGTFAEHHVQLLQTFADQAVIAIENARLFDELQVRTRDLTESLQQQTATADVLKVISASPGELKPVFQAMLENAVRLCEAQFAMLFLYEKERNEYRAVGKWNLPPAWSEFLGKNPLPANPKVPLGRIAITKQPLQIADVLADQAYVDRFPGMVAVAELGGARTLLQVPMLKENELVGAFGIYRQEVRPFSEKQVTLVQNFAAQAVIAIENARLLNELRQRTADLSKSLDDLGAAQDRLVQTEKLASLGQLTAGIAHEIKNPLNFINNFSALSAELIDEMTEVFENPALDEANRRKELDEIRELLKSNLEKVVQHGKRADSIVKNMLLHSREGSREHRPADINSLLDESLNLAYHGARAEKGEFNITLERDFDADAGTIELFPQEITRAFLNLIANGVYAATRRKNEGKELGFEPTLRATTKNLGTSVEIRIRDNGTGIPAEVQEKMFNPFFTTKPAGEGTGLGLSMTHDIIVKQHGGRIDVATEPGLFTEFTIVLPRKSNVPGRDRGET